MKKPHYKARKIVAELLRRERFAKKLLDGIKRSHSRFGIDAAVAYWAEAHNAAEVARRILYRDKHEND
jgi:hypothetical protein